MMKSRFARMIVEPRKRRDIVRRIWLFFAMAPFVISAPARAADIKIKGHVKLEPSTPKKKSEAVVFLEGDFSSQLKPTRAVMAQEGLEFNPHLLVIPRGSTVEFPNRDDEYHNVFSYSKIKRFDLGRYRAGDTPAVQTFEQAGVVKLYCEIHRHMRGIILILDTPFFTMAGEGGDYSLDLHDVPPGKYTLTAWVDEKDVRSAPVTIAAGKPLVVDFPGG
jgi:plastocyanin